MTFYIFLQLASLTFKGSLCLPEGYWGCDGLFNLGITLHHIGLCYHNEQLVLGDKFPHTVLDFL